MPDNKEDAKLIDAKLREIVKCVVKHTRKNPALAQELMGVLGISSSNNTAEFLTHISPASGINPIEILHEKGVDELKAELSLLTDTELVAVVKDNKYKVSVDTKKGIEREPFIEAIIEYASSQLSKGTSFLKENLTRP